MVDGQKQVVYFRQEDGVQHQLACTMQYLVFPYDNYLVSELWIEPQSGYVTIKCLLEKTRALRR